MIKRYFLAMALLALAGCQTSLLYQSPNQLGAELESLVQENRYRQALSLLDGIPTSVMTAKQVSQWQSTIVSQADQYGQQIYLKVKQLQQEHQWQAAEQLLQEGVEQLPDDSLVHHQYQQFTQEKERFLDRQNLELNLLLAEQMMEQAAYREAIYQANPNSWQSQWELKKFERQREEVADYLAIKGMEALKGKRFDEAKKLLTRSKMLSADPQVSELLAGLNSELDQRWIEHLEKREQKRNHYYQQLEVEFRQAVRGNEYLKARQLLEKLQSLRPTDARNGARTAELELAINQKVDSDIARGEKLYTSGDVRVALDIWNRALKLAPEHVELKQNIARAERFLKNYEALSE